MNNSEYKKVCDLMIEPVGEVYLKFIKLFMEHSDTFILVYRREVKLNKNGESLLEKLSKYRYKTHEQNIFAGTQLAEGVMATVHYFKVCEKSIDVLIESANSLYDWVQPNLLEDLSFISNENYVFSMIAHEKKGTIFLSNDLTVKKLNEIGLIGRIEYL